MAARLADHGGVLPSDRHVIQWKRLKIIASISDQKIQGKRKLRRRQGIAPEGLYPKDSIIALS